MAMAGMMGHILYLKWWHSRVTVAAFVILFVNAFFAIPAVMHGDVVGALVDIQTIPFEFVGRHQSWQDTLAMAICFLGPPLFVPTHSLWPSRLTAISTSFGVAFWYSTSVMIMAFAG